MLRMKLEYFSPSFSVDEGDTVFGSRGAWKQCERSICGSEGNSPFEPAFIQSMVKEFEVGAKSHVPYS